VAIAVAATATARADGDGYRGKGKGKGKEGTNEDAVIQLDTGKLPPDLLKQLIKYAAEGDKKAGGRAALPPGLANKPADHPGRVNWLRAHGYPVPAGGGQKKAAGKAAADRGGRAALPPGLANKPADHPGRVNWLRARLPGAGQGQR
jgi:hypothetical protein